VELGGLLPERRNLLVKVGLLQLRKLLLALGGVTGQPVPAALGAACGDGGLPG
jgi:hypothetical protein